jgi:hypothetical protein
VWLLLIAHARSVSPGPGSGDGDYGLGVQFCELLEVPEPGAVHANRTVRVCQFTPRPSVTGPPLRSPAQLVLRRSAHRCAQVTGILIGRCRRRSQHPAHICW